MKFQIVKNKNPTSKQELKKIMDKPSFGVNYIDYMVHIHYENSEWTKLEIVPFGNISISPASCCLQYGSQIFEGCKAYKWADGSVHTFRLEDNAKRFQDSAQRLGMPVLPVEYFVGAVNELLKLQKQWVSDKPGESLYIRPFMIGTDPYLGLRPTLIADFYVICSPVGAYTPKTSGAKIYLETKYFRAGPGGTGDIKCGGNYAASMLSKIKIHNDGFDDVLYLDSKKCKYIEEFSGMSCFLVKENKILTPKLNGSILPSITRDSIIQLAKDLGYEVVEKKVKLEKVIKWIKEKKVTEVFACGTAAVVFPTKQICGEYDGEKFDLIVGNGKHYPVSSKLKELLVGIQTGKVKDKYNWTKKV